MNSQKYTNYVIYWSQPLANWDPLCIPNDQEPEITDFTEAQAVLAQFMTKH